MNNYRFRKLFGRLMALSLAFCLVLGLAGCSGGGKKKTVTGKTPEETLETFFEALSEQDVDTMMACCYVDDCLDRVSFSQYIDRIGTYVPASGGYLVSAPTEYDYYRKLAEYECRARFSLGFKMLTFSLLATDEEYESLLNNMAVAPVDRKWAKDFSRVVDPEALKDLEVLSIDEDIPDVQNDSQVKDNFIKMTGADDCVERTVLLELDDQLFYKGFTLAEIDGRWQIYSLNAVILGESANGAATQVDSKQDYRDIIE